MARQLLQENEIFSVRETELELTIQPDPEAVYYLRPITAEIAREIAAKHTRHVPNRRTHLKDDVVDKQAVNDEILDYMIAKWEGVMEKGVLAPCDLPHKLRLPVEVQAALIERAQVGEADKASSFRQPA